MIAETTDESPLPVLLVLPEVLESPDESPDEDDPPPPPLPPPPQEIRWRLKNNTIRKKRSFFIFSLKFSKWSDNFCHYGFVASVLIMKAV